MLPQNIQKQVETQKSLSHQSRNASISHVDGNNRFSVGQSHSSGVLKQQPSLILTSADQEEFILLAGDDCDPLEREYLYDIDDILPQPLPLANHFSCPPSPPLLQNFNDEPILLSSSSSSHAAIAYPFQPPQKARRMLDIPMSLMSPLDGYSSSVDTDEIEKGTTSSKEKSTWDRLLSHTFHRSRSAGCDMPEHEAFLEKYSKKVRPSEPLNKTKKNKTEEFPTEGKLTPDTPREKKSLWNIANDFTDKLNLRNQRRLSVYSTNSNWTTSCLSKSMFFPPTRLGGSSSALTEEVDEYGKQLSVERFTAISRSFDALLADPIGLELFYKFLLSEYSEENILFWIACQSYKKLTKTKKICKEARRIYQEFLSAQAPKEINLDSRTRLQTISTLSNPNRLSFELAEKKIQGLMERDSYPRFLRSTFYNDLKAKIQCNSSS